LSYCNNILQDVPYKENKIAGELWQIWMCSYNICISTIIIADCGP
jgi:hypothetical protein